MRKFAPLSIFMLLAAGLLAPVIANDRPILAVVNGALCSPALASVAGTPSAAPGGRTWKEWWADLPPGGPDWAVMPPWPWGPGETSDGVNEAPSWRHPLGRDDTGRDQLARLLHGTTTALGIGLGAVLLALLIGVPFGVLAGYHGGLADRLVSRVIEVFLCFPALFLVLAIGAFTGSSVLAVVFVLGSVYWTGIARIVRGELLSLREREFVLTARGLGVGRASLWLRHMLPAVRGPVLVTAAFLIANAVVVESTLSFLGLSAGPQVVSWGAMLQQGKAHAHEGAWHLWLFPGLAVAVTVWTFHAVADRDRSHHH